MQTLKTYTIKHRRDDGVTRYTHHTATDLRKAALQYASWAGYGTIDRILPAWDGTTRVYLTMAKYPLEIKR